MATIMDTQAPHTVTELQFQPAKAAFPSPNDWRDQFIYFLLVDRFDNNADLTGYDPSNPNVGRNPGDGKYFQGGTLQGVTRRLEYIKNLGCTAIWLSPILKNRLDLNDTYHGYGIQDFLEVDPRFGTVDDLKRLVREAHKRNMYVIMDVVLNHAGDVWSYPGDYAYYYNQGESFPFGQWREEDLAAGFQTNDAIWPVELQHADAFKRKGQIRNWDDARETQDGDFFSLKELNLPKPEVLDSLIKIYKYWIAQTDIDGFRIDTVKHMEQSATAIFCNAIREYAQRIGKHRFFMFGEIVAGDEMIQQYIGRNARVDGTTERFPSLDSALDFPLYGMLEEVIKGFASPECLRNRLDAFRTNYVDHGEAGRYFVTFLDNHDQMMRPYRRFMHNNPYPEQAILGIGFLLTSLGVPCIYYGTEQGFDGGGPDDSYIRECMFGGKWGAFESTGRHFFNPEHIIYRGIQMIATIRKREPALRYGRQYFREISGNGVDFGHPFNSDCTLAFSRILDSEEILVAMNLASYEREDYITIDKNLSGREGKMQNLLSASYEDFDISESNGRACVQVRLPKYGMAILKRV